MKYLDSLIFGILHIIIVTHSATAQIIEDGTTSTTITPTDKGVKIDKGNNAGSNLFHSFKEFSVPTGSEAHFNSSNDVTNIFSRVTGGNVSQINGLIRANGAANLFFNITMKNSGLITSSTLGTGAGGDIIINASESINLLKTSSNLLFSTGIFSNSIFSKGKAGNIRLKTQELNIRNGGQIVSISGALVAGRQPISEGGKGGDIDIIASSLQLSGSSGSFQSIITKRLEEYDTKSDRQNPVFIRYSSANGN